MAKYDDSVKAQVVEAAKSGVPLAEIARQFGPNVKAIQRYCVKAGVVLPKAEKKAKTGGKKAKKAKVEEE